jgi:hypothetical protein
VRRLLSSPRKRRRAAWGAAVLTAAAAAALIGFLYPNTGQKEAKFTPGKPKVVHEEPRATPLSKADRTSAQNVVDAFVTDAVLRKHLGRSYDLVTVEMREGMSRREWRTQDIPVVPFPLRDFVLAKSKLDYSHGNVARYEVLMYARPDGPTASGLFSIELHALGGGSARHWLVDYWQPMGGGISTPAVPRVNPLDLRNEPSATAQPLGTSWVLVPLAVLSLIVLLPLGIGVRGWVRNRRIDRAYGTKTLPPLKPPTGPS